VNVVVSTPRGTEDEGEFEPRKQGAKPFPESATVFGLFAAFEVMVSVPVCAPVVVGAKVTVTAQLFPGASDAGHVLVSVNCPLTVMLEIVTGAEPVLVSVTVPGWHVWFTCVSGNCRLLVESVTAAPLIPVPARVMLCGLPEASSVIVTAPVRVPVAVGVKVTGMRQLAPAPSVEPMSN
jgi:hypothetical protein